MQPSQKITRGIITTNKGVIEISFLDTTPNTVKNFVTLAQSKFYDGVRFHRVIKDFMIQAGDPFSKDKEKMSSWGTGGPGYTFNDELTGKEQYTFGTLAMANAGPNTNGSQFFIVTANPSVPLPPNYTVFGKVTRGMDIATKIQDVATTGSPSDRPLEDIVIEKIEVME
ncbi:MAG: peptidylprolyl isomerase [Candidatus Pacebacteria bacterium]|nr:peptidylprolyl isomerase [Candidatus Paceibacterota bacterium]MBP9867121.1 peptidylprolyl isomerase [Candidatus Paceibacterota bacterium]